MASIERKMVPGAPPPGGPYSHAVVHNGLVYCAGQVGVDAETGEFGSDIAEQTRNALNNLKIVLEGVGSDLTQVISARVFVRNFDDREAMNEVFTEFFDAHRPARTTIPCSGFPGHFLVEIDVIAALGPTS